MSTTLGHETEMSMSSPGARITIDGSQLAADEAAVVRLRVDLAADGTHDQVWLQCWSRSRFATAAAGAAMSLSLGERGAEEPVWTGEVSGRRLLPQAVVLDGIAATVTLSRSARSQSYLNQTVADIVRDLAGSATIDKVESDLKLHAYHVDNRRPLWSHLKDLARLVDADLCSAADGGLRFVPAGAAVTPLALRYGADLLDWSLSTRSTPQAAAVAAYGAASEQGAARWHWIGHDPLGAGAAATRLPAALATRDAAQLIGEALAQRARRTAIAGEVLVVGSPKIRPGDAIELTDLPSGNPGILRVRSLRHTFDVVSGFLTRLRLEGAGSTAGGAS